MKKKLAAVYYIFLVAGIVLVFAAFLHAQNHVERKDGAAKEAVAVTPEEEKSPEENVREYYFSADQFQGANLSLVFYTVHHEVWVYEDGELIYSLNAVESVFGKTPGSGWNFADINPNGDTVVVRVRACYPQISHTEITFYKGGAQDIVLSLMRQSALAAGVSLLDIAVGAALIIYFFIVNRSIRVGKHVLYFGIFAVFMGIWSLNETTLMELFCQNAVAASFLSYMCLMVMLAPFAMFIHGFLNVKNQWMMPALVWASIANLAVCVTLHLTGISEFRETVTGTHVLMGLEIVFFIYALVCHVRKNGWNRLAVVNVVGIGILLAAFSVDVLAFYFVSQRADVIGRFGFLAYIALLAWEAASDSLRQLHEGQKAAIYKELAMKDMLTGLYNRNAYDAWKWEHKRPADTAVVMFDLNNLKKCNDLHGHSAGDAYLKKAAELIERHFSGMGKVYRIGGDEFCAVLPGAQRGNIEQQLRRLREDQENANGICEGLSVEIASGYAIFNEKEDADFEAARNRADALMYEDKRAIKKARGKK